MTLPLLSALVLLQPQPNLATVKTQIQERYDQWSKAYMAQDVDVLLSMLAPDYVLTSIQKEKTTYAQYAAYLRLKKRSGYKDPVKTSTRVQGLKLNGNEAAVDAIETMVTQAPDPKTQKTAWCLHRHEYLDVWKLDGSAWVLHATTTLKESTEYKARPI